MADRHMVLRSRAGRPRTRQRSAHLPSCIPVAPKAGKPRTNSEQRTLAKGKGKCAGKGKKATKKSDEAAAVVSSDSEDLEVDFPHYPPNQSHKIPTDLPQEPNPPVDIPVEEPQELNPLADSPVKEQQEPDHPVDILIEEPPHPAHVPAGDTEQPQEPGNLNLLLIQPPIPMEKNQLKLVSL